MDHIIFITLHLISIMFGIVGLVVTIPLHLIYCLIISVARYNKRLQLKIQSRICEHCGKPTIVDGVCTICKLANINWI